MVNKYLVYAKASRVADVSIRDKIEFELTLCDPDGENRFYFPVSDGVYNTVSVGTYLRFTIEEWAD